MPQLTTPPLGRETFLFPITWSAGWPVINAGQPIAQHLPGVLHDKSPLQPFADEFTAPTLDPSFYFLRTPYKPFHSLRARPGFLRLSANAYAVGDRDVPALLLRKQTSYEETFEVLMDFAPGGNALAEAGVSIFYGDFLHNEIGVVGDASGGGTRFLITRTIVQASQVGPWALTSSNNTITTVGVLCAFVDVNVQFFVGQDYGTGYGVGSDQADYRRELDVVFFGLRRRRGRGLYFSSHDRFGGVVNST